MEDLREKLESWFDDKYSLDFTDDLSEKEKDKLEAAWFKWQDVVELILHSEYFDLLYRFIEQVAATSDDIADIEVTRRKVIIKNG